MTPEFLKKKKMQFYGIFFHQTYTKHKYKFKNAGINIDKKIKGYK